MKGRLFSFGCILLCLSAIPANSQITDTTNYNYGVWQAFGNPISRFQESEVRGRLVNFRWADLETAPNIWNWIQFDSDLNARAQDSLPIIFMVYTESDAPTWLYTNGVPKVAEKNSSGVVIAYTPYYNDTSYQRYFERMITMVHQHVEQLPANIRKKIIAVQGCFGSTGDYIGYKGTVDSQYQITNSGFLNLFKLFSQYMYNEYKNTIPKIYLLSNPSNTGSTQYTWLIQNLPGSWVKTGSLGKGYQLNDEVTKASWLYPLLNSPQSGNYVRARSEIIGNGITSGWWTKCPYKNMFALMCYGIYWGLDWSNEGAVQINDPLFDSSFSFYNKYAGQKDPSKSSKAMCALRDGLDAADGIRFPAAIYGTVVETASRFQKILKPFIPYGAKLEDTVSAILPERNNLAANGINDVGWGIFPGNYDRYLHQLNANATSAGYWNVSSADSNSMYGRFARGFDVVNGKNDLYFDIDSSFLRNAPLNGQYPVMVEITYLDKGTGSWQLFYDAINNNNKPSLAITCHNTNFWKKVSVTLPDGYFGNKSINASDLYIKNTATENVLFSLVELTRLDANSAIPGFFASNSLIFDTICVNTTSNPSTFTLSGSFLTDSITVIGPLKGFSFSTSVSGNFTDSLILKGYGASFYKTIYVKFQPNAIGNYSGKIAVRSRGTATVYVSVTANAINSSPVLSAAITDVKCFNSNNGAINLSLTGGVGPFTYSWSGGGLSNVTTQDINSLAASTYSVVVTSLYPGCIINASYALRQPAPLIMNTSFDSLFCINGTTNVYVSASGGTAPFKGMGTFSSGAGIKSYTVTDGNGCAVTQSVTIPNGTLTVPATPGNINTSNNNLCGGGSFNYSIISIPNVSSYTWSVPLQTTIASTSTEGTSITLNVSSTFSNGPLSVKANNVCGSSSTQTLNLTVSPQAPGLINGPVSVQSLQSGLTYTVLTLPQLTYLWTVPPGVQILSGQNTGTITLKWGTKSGELSVQALNNCSSSSASILKVSVKNSNGNNNNFSLSSILSNPSASAVTENTFTFKNHFSIYPNPAQEVVHVNFSLPKSSSYSIFLTDLRGKLLLRKEGFAWSLQNQVDLDVHQFAEGQYFITILNNKVKLATVRLVKL